MNTKNNFRLSYHEYLLQMDKDSSVTRFLKKRMNLEDPETILNIDEVENPCNNSLGPAKITKIVRSSASTSCSQSFSRMVQTTKVVHSTYFHFCSGIKVKALGFDEFKKEMTFRGFKIAYQTQFKMDAEFFVGVYFSMTEKAEGGKGGRGYFAHEYGRCSVLISEDLVTELAE